MLAVHYVDSVELRSEKSHGKSVIQFIVEIMPAQELLGWLNDELYEFDTDFFYSLLQNVWSTNGWDQ